MSDAPHSSSANGADQSTQDRIRVPPDETFTVVANTLLYDFNLTTHEKLLAIAIRSHCHGSADQSWPSNSRLCKIVGCALSTLQNARQGLVDKGYLGIERRESHESNLYTMRMIHPLIGVPSPGTPPTVSRYPGVPSPGTEKNKRKIQEKTRAREAPPPSPDSTPGGSGPGGSEERSPPPESVREWLREHPGVPT